MLTRTYKDLIFWQNAFQVTKAIIRLASKLPRIISVRIILDQLLRASSSVGANIAEGYGRFGSKEYTRYLQVSLGSANESEHWLLLLRETCPKFGVEIDQIINQNTESIKMLAASLRTLRLKKS